jgi:hypothetical protein
MNFKSSRILKITGFKLIGISIPPIYISIIWVSIFKN